MLDCHDGRAGEHVLPARAKVGEHPRPRLVVLDHLDHDEIIACGLTVPLTPARTDRPCDWLFTVDTSRALAALLEPHRLMVAGALCDSERTSDQLVVQTGLTPPAVLQAIGALRHAGLVEVRGDGYILPADRLRDLAVATADAQVPMDPFIGYGMTDDERVVLARFFNGRNLRQLPVDRSTRLIVLERLALEFDIGVRYDEAEVNRTLRTFHPDVAALRRHLVDEQLLDRDHGEYWRAGGRIPSTA